MALLDLLKIDFSHCDERGSLLQLVHKGYNQVNVITSNAGVIRGGHYHKINKEAFFVISGKLCLKLELDGNTEEYQFVSGDFFRINENVVHEFYFEEDTLLVSMYSKGVELEDGRKDMYSV